MLDTRSENNKPCMQSLQEPLFVGIDFVISFMQMTHRYTCHSNRMKTLCKYNPSHSLRTVSLTLRDGCVQTSSNPTVTTVLLTFKHNVFYMEHVTRCVGDINIISVNTVRHVGIILDCALNMQQ